MCQTTALVNVSNGNSFGVQNEWVYVKLTVPHSFYIQIL